MTKYHLIPMNMNKYNIDEMISSIKKYNHIEWNNGNKEGKYAHPFQENDIVYIYCTNLPDGSRRILFRSTVKAVNNRKKGQKSFYITNIATIKLKQKSRIRKEYDYSYEVLKKKYDFKINQSMRYLAHTQSENKENELRLIKDLEKDYRNSNEEKDQAEVLEELKNYFNNKIWCECCEILIENNKLPREIFTSRTFVKNNGLVFYELHHLLMQNILRKNKIKDKEWFKNNKWYDDNEEDKKMINDDYNCIVLCPVCHMELHHGDNEEYKNKYGIKKETIIKELMKRHQFDTKLEAFKKSPKEIKMIKRYILQQYVKLTNKDVFEDIIDSILKEKSIEKNDKLIKLLEKYDAMENKSCYENGNYIKIPKEKFNKKGINDDYILDLNVNRKKRIERLDILNSILKNKE